MKITQGENYGPAKHHTLVCHEIHSSEMSTIIWLRSSEHEFVSRTLSVIRRTKHELSSVSS